MTMQDEELLPWSDQVDWWANPRLAYAKGIEDGRAIGRDEVNAEIVRALSLMLSDNETDNYVEAVRIHERRTAQARARYIADWSQTMRAPAPVRWAA